MRPFHGVVGATRSPLTLAAPAGGRYRGAEFSTVKKLQQMED